MEYYFKVNSEVSGLTERILYGFYKGLSSGLQDLLKDLYQKDLKRSLDLFSMDLLGEIQENPFNCWRSK